LENLARFFIECFLNKTKTLLNVNIINSNKICNLFIIIIIIIIIFAEMSFFKNKNSTNFAILGVGGGG
jgi:hypothetical protein